MINTKEKINCLKLEKLYVQYRNLMFHEANRVLHNSFDAEDAVQYAFVKLTKCADRIDDTLPSMTCNFLKVVARNAAIDVYKRKLYLNTYENSCDIYENELIERDVEIADIVIDKFSAERIIEKIKCLPNNYRDIIILEKICGYTREETMELLGENYETIKKRMTRAKTKLLDVLKREELNGGINSIRPNG